MIGEKIALLQEWFRPAAVGAYFDGDKFHLAEDNKHPGRRPARAFVALSHRLLYFHLFKIPKSIDQKALKEAAGLEARRIFVLLEKRPAGEISCALISRKLNELYIVFQEKEFFKKTLKNLPSGLIPCGVVPAGMALLAYFYHKNRKLVKGAYYVETASCIEGVVVDENGLKEFLPASPGTAKAYLKDFDGEIFTVEGEGEKILAEGARLLPLLPEKYLVTFEGFPLTPRPKISLSMLILWLLPVATLAAGNILNYKAAGLENQIKAADKKVSSLRKSLAEIEEFEKRKEAYKTIETTLKEWQAENVDYIEVIRRLTEILPEDTWVRRLEFREAREVRLWAEGENALEVLQVIADDPLFEDAKFLSTVTKNTRTGKEIFSIVMKIKKEK
ncbi:Fimbrial assembly family protein [Thermodesulfatator indicus DSM 15286]|uniref:Fimbrial assembly family protein n=1 Tax=Thermodesulfatator indicus (strain DSM 15286 / JCM 11887 / CIR29812) TaxID=667014 RepID=F8A9T1_THEID|nr:PilN domain-containing protein [Thermodesulfatator indicus]AEH45975.1 Fimbrial assembly family protein [Thermodesulfatator indicus DSM 15286]